jgi:hypothetical protein
VAGVLHQTDTPHLAGKLPQSPADIDAVLIEQRFTHPAIIIPIGLPWFLHAFSIVSRLLPFSIRPYHQSDWTRFSAL